MWLIKSYIYIYETDKPNVLSKMCSNNLTENHVIFKLIRELESTFESSRKYLTVYMRWNVCIYHDLIMIGRPSLYIVNSIIKWHFRCYDDSIALMMDASCVINDDVAALRGWVSDRFVAYVVHEAGESLTPSSGFRANRVQFLPWVQRSRDVRHGDVFSGKWRLPIDQRTTKTEKIADRAWCEREFGCGL